MARKFDYLKKSDAYGALVPSGGEFLDIAVFVLETHLASNNSNKINMRNERRDVNRKWRQCETLKSINIQLLLNKFSRNYFLKCSPQTSKISIAWEPTENANSQILPDTQ